jgi:hypothetical protein
MNFGTIPVSIDGATTSLKKPAETDETCRYSILLLDEKKEEYSAAGLSDPLLLLLLALHAILLVFTHDYIT